MALCSTINDIEKICSTRSGLKNIHLIRQASIITVPAVCCPVEQAGNIEVSAPLVPVHFYNEDADYSFNLVTDNRAGDYVKHQLSFTVPKGRSAIDKLLLSAMNQTWAVRFEQTDGTIRLLQNMRLSVVYSTDKTRSGKNAYTFTLTGRTEYPTGYFSGNVTASGPWITEDAENWITDDDETWTYVF